MSTNSEDVYARVAYAELTKNRLDCRPWHELPDCKREAYRRAAAAVVAETRRTVRTGGRVVGMRPRTAVATEMEETGT